MRRGKQETFSVVSLTRTRAIPRPRTVQLLGLGTKVDFLGWWAVGFKDNSIQQLFNHIGKELPPPTKSPSFHLHFRALLADLGSQF